MQDSSGHNGVVAAPAPGKIAGGSPALVTAAEPVPVASAAPRFPTRENARPAVVRRGARSQKWLEFALRRAARLHRAASAFALALLVVTGGVPDPAEAADAARLRAEVNVSAEVVTVADLVDGVVPSAGRAVFRAPDVGTAGVVPAPAVIAALRAAGVADIAAGDVVEVTVRRIGRLVTGDDIAALITAALEGRLGAPADRLAIAFDTALPSLSVGAGADAAPTLAALGIAAAGGRFEAVVTVPGARAGERTRITGTAVEVAEIVTPVRPIAAGEAITTAHLRVDRVPARGVRTPAPAMESLVGLVARRALQPGIALVAGDFAEPLMVKRGDMVLLLYRTDAMTLTMSGRALANGAAGASVPVINLRSDRVIQTVVTGPGTVEVVSGRRIASVGAR